MSENINKQLESLYKEILNKDNLIKKFTTHKLTDYSAPFLLKIDKNYLTADKKILFVGKETNRWWGRLKDFTEHHNAVQILQQRYTAELFGGEVPNKHGEITKYKKEQNWNNQFFTEYKKMRKKLLNSTEGALVWSNLLKFDNAKSSTYSRNTKNDKTVIEISKQIFLKELEILQPDYIVFATSYTYDTIIKDYFDDEIKDSLVIEPHSLWKFKYKNIICYRTWHPATIKYKALKNKLDYYEDIIQYINK